MWWNTQTSSRCVTIILWNITLIYELLIIYILCKKFKYKYTFNIILKELQILSNILNLLEIDIL